ncbi:MAG: hypothetical protein JF597_07195 [Streptomyces sp.]|uniref:hypothetical protein n=1 Tax=Streptomyces sp. TaxID=1931 RepID=UPI0025E7D3A0|nr:hypothetical protein [Streptomyces sp.]MBW8793375.1 hypothetical protein [Streptomyces sp.]
MRSASLPRLALAAALCCVVLSGCGPRNSTTDRTPGVGAVSTAAPLAASASADDPEMRFFALLTRIDRACAPGSPTDTSGGGVPEPEDLPGWEGASEPRYGAGETPPGIPNAGGDIPVPVDGPTPPDTAPATTEAKPVEEVPLTGVEKCDGGEHVKRISKALRDASATSYRTMHERLTELDYPASRIHRMPNRSGALRARLDLRMMGSHLALEVTGVGDRVIVEAFGAPETEGTNVTDVNRKPKPGASPS